MFVDVQVGGAMPERYKTTILDPQKWYLVPAMFALISSISMDGGPEVWTAIPVSPGLQYKEDGEGNVYLEISQHVRYCIGFVENQSSMHTHILIFYVPFQQRPNFLEIGKIYEIWRADDPNLGFLGF